MDVKSAFLYVKIEEEVYIYQPSGFEDPDFPDIVYKVEKALFGLHQAPKAWYETLSTYLLDNGFKRGKIDKTLFIRRDKGDILLVQVYVDDIIFGSTKKSLCTEFEKMMHKKFQMSSMGELTFFLGLQVKQKEDGIFISQDKYVTEILKKFGFTNVKTASTPMETQKPLLKDEDGEEVDVHLYRSMIGSLMYLTSLRPDIMFAVCACARYQVNPKVSHLHAVKRIFRYLKGQPKLGLWYLKDSPFDLVAYTDSDYAGASLDRKSITGVKNPVFHSKTKHIEIRHHFIRDSNEKKLIQMIKIHTDKNVTDLLTKAFDNRIRVNAGDSKLMLLGINLLLLGNVNAARYNLLLLGKVNAARHKLTGEGMATVKMKTVNGEQQLQALVDRKKIIITEATVRKDLQLKDTTAWNEFSSTMASANICLATNQNFKFSKYIFESMVKNLDNAVKFLMYPSDPTNIADEAVHEEPSMQLKELMDFCTKLKQRVLDLENTKTAQAREITSLKKRVKKLEKNGESRTHKLKRLYRVGRYARVVSSKEASLGDQEDASKQGRKINDIDKDAEITLVDETQVRYRDEDMFRVNDLDGDEVVVKREVTKKAGEKRSIIEEAVVVTDVVTISVKGQGSKDKGKAKMIEPEKPLKKKDQIMFDEEEALKLQAKFDKEDRLAREKAQQVEEANIAWDDIQVKIDADYQLAERLQAQEQHELTIEEKSTFFVQLLEKRKKHFAAKRAEEKRNRPPTKAQQRSIMCTYLKNMAGWKPKDIKNKSFANIQELFDKAMKRVNTFVDMDTDLVKGIQVREEGSEIREESNSKRARDKLEQENAKKQKMDDDQEAAKMKELIKIIPDEEEVAVDAIPLATKPPSIVDWKIIKKGNISYYQIIRADGSSRRYSAFIQMLKSFDREDLETLWKLVKAKHGYTRPEEGYERVLWGDLKTMFEHHVEDAVWRNLQESKVLVWKLFDSCGVHFVRFQNLHVFMLVEKKYPLTPATITAMLNTKLQAIHFKEMCCPDCSLVSGLQMFKTHDMDPLSAYELTESRLRPYHFNYPERSLKMEEMLNKFIDEGKREHKEMRTFIYDFQTTNELLFKERSNSLIELRFGVQELLKVINNVLMIDCNVKRVTTRGGKSMTQDVYDNNTNVLPKEPLVVELEKPVGPNNVLTNDQPQMTSELVVQPSNELPSKEKDPGSFTIPYDIGQLHIDNALADLGASISLMPYTMYKKLGLREPKATRMSLELADRPTTEDDECYGIDDLNDTIKEEAQELLANEEPDSFLSRGLEKSIDQSDLECCESASSDGNNESDPENSIRRIDYANTPYPVTQGTTKRDDVKSEHLYSASANKINEKKPELKNLPQHLEYAYLHKDC
ncbi:putative ribonuclease H-like domain-containing protein [Tanacetum coccineum]